MKPSSNVEVGISSSQLYGPNDFHKYNPDDLLYNKGVAVYKRMLKDDQVKAVMLFKQYAIVSRDWYFEIEQDENGEDKLKWRISSVMLSESCKAALLISSLKFYPR